MQCRRWEATLPSPSQEFSYGRPRPGRKSSRLDSSLDLVWKNAFYFSKISRSCPDFFRSDSKKVHEIHSKLYQGDQFNRNIFPAFLTNKRPQGTKTTEYLIYIFLK